MNTNKLFLTGFLSIFLLFTSCGTNDDGDGTTTNENPNAVTGIYSGVLVGSTGAYELNFTATNSSASVLFDGTNYTLSSDKLLEKGKSITLTDGTISLVFTVDANGENPSISFTIPGHTIEATLILAGTTTNRNYIGETTNTRNGIIVNKSTFNLTLHNDNKWTGIEKVIVSKIVFDNERLEDSGDAGMVTRVSGVFTEDNNSINFFRNNSDPIFEVDKLNDKLILEQESSFDDGNGGTVVEVFKVTLTKV